MKDLKDSQSSHVVTIYLINVMVREGHEHLGKEKRSLKWGYEPIHPHHDPYIDGVIWRGTSERLVLDLQGLRGQISLFPFFVSLFASLLNEHSKGG